MHSIQLLLVALAAQLASSRDVPSNIRTFYNNIKTAGSCSNKLQSGFYALDDGPNTFSYCGDHLNDDGVIYLQGTGGAMADMDIDCDGLQHGVGDDGRCKSSGDTQSHTSFEDTVAGYGQGVTGLNAFVHPYVVFGNVGTKSGYVNFDPTKKGVQPLSIIAVVCGDQMFYGIWGDENGDDGDKSMIGEASISMATFCFGNSVNGNSGHTQTDVLYIAFTGADAVPGKTAKWNAGSKEEFENSISALGDKLIQRIGGGTATTTSRTTTTSAGSSCPTAGCTWAGHCLCAACSTDDDCSDSLVCKSGKCANP